MSLRSFFRGRQVFNDVAEVVSAVSKVGKVVTKGVVKGPRCHLHFSRQRKMKSSPKDGLLVAELLKVRREILSICNTHLLKEVLLYITLTNENA